jgi:hypothetical protein
VAEQWAERLRFDRERHGRPYEQQLLDEALDALHALDRPSRTSCSATRTCTAGTSLSAERGAVAGVERQRVRRWTIAKHLAWATGGQYFPDEVEIVRLGVEVGSRG